MVLFQARPVDPLNHDVAIVDERGRPTPQFMRQWALARTFAVETQAIITYGTEWDDIVGKPATFPPSPHTHDTADVISGTFASARISQGSVTQYQGVFAIGWAQLTGVPATFPPSAHQHDWADITGEPATYAPSAHTHPASEITAGTFAAGNFVFQGALSVTGGNTTLEQAAGFATNTPASYAIIVKSGASTLLTMGVDANGAYIQSWASRTLWFNNRGNPVGFGGEVAVNVPAWGQYLFSGMQTGDAFLRFIVADKVYFGSGAAVYDTTLYRSGVGILKTDGAFHIAGTLTLTGKLVSEGAAGSAGAGFRWLRVPD